MAEDEKPDEAPVRRKRTPKPADEICPQCWPKGWPGEDNAANCIHGSYKR